MFVQDQDQKGWGKKLIEKATVNLIISIQSTVWRQSAWGNNKNEIWSCGESNKGSISMFYPKFYHKLSTCRDLGINMLNKTRSSTQNFTWQFHRNFSELPELYSQSVHQTLNVIKIDRIKEGNIKTRIYQHNIFPKLWQSYPLLVLSSYFHSYSLCKLKMFSNTIMQVRAWT